jgi:hypothetical protein
MAEVPKKSVPHLVEGMSEEHRRMVAEGIATMHRFSAAPSFKHGKPQYQGNTVGAAGHLKAKRGS